MAIEADRSEAARVAREYFEALGHADSDAPRRFYRPNGVAHLPGVFGPGTPDELATFTEQARASMRKLAALEPATAWAGHAEPLMGDVRGQLERAAATT